MLFKKEVIAVLSLVGSSAAFAPSSPAFVSVPSKSCAPVVRDSSSAISTSKTAPSHSRGFVFSPRTASTTQSISTTALSACRCPDCMGGGNSLSRTAQHSAGCSCPSCSGSGARHHAACPCPACSSQSSRTHSTSCSCTTCRRKQTRLFSDATTTTAEPDNTDDAVAVVDPDVPTEVAALDGIESSEEMHNTDRPARKTLRKKTPSSSTRSGKPISEFNVGDTVKATVKAITTYGAFLDIGATTDGLLHISQLSVDFVSDVNTMLQMGQEVDVRIINIDQNKNQVALSLMTEEEAETAKEASNRSRDRPQRGGGGGGTSNNRRDDSPVLAQLVQKGWNPDQFVEGTVVSTVDFGAFVRIDASQLQEGVEGEFDGLVHISCLTAGRASSVGSIVSVDDKVQVRVKAIADRKVSLTMVSPEDEAAKLEAMGSSSLANSEGAKDWKESLEKLRGNMPTFKNKPMVVDLRK
ncbi:hypothetical protein ACA910_021928 [Epithemia clementina (nom. ined.)]